MRCSISGPILIDPGGHGRVELALILLLDIDHIFQARRYLSFKVVFFITCGLGFKNVQRGFLMSYVLLKFFQVF